MKRILLLNEKQSGFPSLFYKHPIIKQNPQFDFEKEIIDKINAYNPKLKIEKIEYSNINENFGFKNTGKFFGLIVDLYDYDKNNTSMNKVKLGLIDYNYKIFGYVFISTNEENSRNTLYSQIVFPELIEIIEMNLKSQSFEVSNKPIYLINLINTQINSDYIIQEINMMKAIGINIVNIFNNGLDNRKYLYNFVDFQKKYKPNKKLFDFNINKDGLYRLKLDAFDEGIKYVSGKYEVFGSSEKFYWLAALCITKLAFDSDINIDLTVKHLFETKYSNEINSNSTKFVRTELLFKYLEKLKKGM